MSSSTSGGRDSALSFCSSPSQPPYSASTYPSQPRGPQPSVDSASYVRADGMPSPWNAGHRRAGDGAPAASPSLPRTRSTLAGFDFFTHAGDEGTSMGSPLMSTAMGGGAGHRESFAVLAQRKNPLGAFDLSRNHQPTSCRPHVFHLDPLHDLEDDLPRQRAGANGGKTAGGPWQPPRIGMLVRSSSSMSSPPNRLPRIESPTMSSPSRAASTIEGRLGLRTGEDCVLFFGTAGHSKHGLRCIFLVRANNPKTNFRPYDLVVAQSHEISSEYFTMTPDGVTHVRPGMPSKFTALADFMRESSLFNALAALPFMRTFYLAKAHARLSSCVRRSAFEKSLQSVQSLSMYTCPCYGSDSFGQVLRRTAAICHLIQQVVLFDCKEIRHTRSAVDFSDFTNSQHTVLEAGVLRLRELSAQAVDVLANFAREAESLKVRPLEGQIGDMVPGTEPTVIGFRGLKHKGMVQLKVDRQASDQKFANIRRNIERTSDLARACDYMICASLLAVARAAAAEIDHLLANPPKKFGYFSILLCLGPQPRSIDMSPNFDDISNGLKAIDNAMCSSLNALPRVLHGREYAHLIPREAVGLVLPQVFESDFPMLSCRRKCDAVLANNFARGAEFAKDFAELWAIKLHTSNFDLVRGLREDCANENRTVELLNSAKYIKRELQTLKKFAADLDRKKMSSHVGTLQVEGRTLRANLSASISGCVEIIRRELHETARASCTHALAMFTAHLKALQRRPNSLKEFAAFLDVKSEITADVRNLYQLSAAVDEMYRVMNSIEVRVSAAEHVKLDDLHSVHGKVVETLANADSDCASRMPVMSQALDKSVAALNDELLNMLTSLHTGIYDNPESSTKVVLRELSICNENIDAVQEKTRLYARYQTAFKISPYDFSYLKTVRDFCLDRIDVWSKLDSFRGSIAKIYDTAFDASVASAFRALMEQTGAAVAAAVKKNDADKIAAKCVRSAECSLNCVRVFNGGSRYMAEFKLHAAYSDIIEALGNSAMRPSHWKKIYGILGMSVIDDRLPKFRELQKYKLEAAATAIMDVSACATGEHVLRKQMEEIESKLPLWTFEFSDVGTVTNFEALSIDIEAAAMMLKSMKLSRFCDIVSDRMQPAAASVELYLRVVRVMGTLQQMWLMLRGVMESTEAVIIMPDEHASFARVNGAWKELLLRTSKRTPQVHALMSSKDSVGFEARLLEHTAVLEKCLLKLDQLVDIKCQSFPRLLLLERADVIRLLSCGPIGQENVGLFQAAVRVCFPGVDQLLFHVRSEKDGGAWLVKGVQPVNARCILLNTQVVAGAMDKWLKDTLIICRETLQSSTDEAVAEHCKANEDVWMLQRPKQCVELALKVIMHQTIESLLLQRQDGTTASAQALDDLATQCDASSKERSRLLNSNVLHAADQSAVTACVLIGMHFRDTLHHLHHSNCATVDDFAWLSVMRMTWLQADPPSAQSYVMKVFDYQLPYGFDVNPGDAAHVTAPQTTRFNLGIVSAVRAMCCCHALCGPSGCGKTSLIRNLAATLGRSLVSADVQSNVSADRMPQLLSAAASSLIWIALDHVHKWSPEILSSFSQSLLSVLAAVRSSALSANVMEIESRSERPDAARGGVLFFLTAPEAYFPSASLTISSAVSQNFRPSQVKMPDIFAVAEAFFVVNGFDSSKQIATKIQHLYTEWNSLLPLPCHQLSIKIVEAVASCARRISGGCSASPARELECTGTALRLVVMPRCPPELLSLVEPLVQLLFPAPAAALQWPLQAEAVKPAFGMAQMTWCDGMGAIAAHLCSVIQVSTAVVVVGSCCTGKSSLITIASAHFSLQKPAVEMTSIDPHCCASQLFAFRSSSGVVSDGIVSMALNGSAESSSKSSRRWLHCDGDMTSASEMLLSHTRVQDVLQRDPGASFDRLVFETDNLHQASPSLLGMLSVVYCPVEMLPHKIYLEDLVKTLKFPNKSAQQQVAELLLSLLPRALDSLFPKGHGSVEAHCLQYRQLMTNVVLLIASMFTSEASDMPSSSCAKLFTFCMFWGLAGGIGRRMWDEVSSSYVEGDAFIQLLGARVRSVCCTAAMLPPVGDSEELHEYCVSDAGDWCRWDSMRASPLPLRSGTAAVYVQTSRTAPCLHILTNLAAQCRHAALIGGRGSGKRVLVDALTAKLSDVSPASSSSVVFSVATFRTLASNDSAPVLALEFFLRNLLHLSEAGCYVPERCVNLVVAVDDMASCPPSARPSLNSALRQFFGSSPVGSRSALGGMYDLQKCGLVHRITGTSAVVTASTFDFMSPRVARYLVAVHLAAPSEKHLISVFEAVAAAAFSACAPDVRTHMVKLASVTASVYHQTLLVAAPAAATFFPIPHPSDCLKVIYGCAVSGSANTGSTKALHRVWLHEMCRVFRDRFTSSGSGEFDTAFKGVCSRLLETQVTDANISQLWTRFLSLDGVYAPVSNLDLVTDLLHSRLSEFHKKHKERISLILDRAAVTAVAAIARVLQQPSGHLALLNYNQSVSRALCFFSGFVSDFNVVEMPAIDSAAAGTAFLRAVAVQCIERNTQIALIIKEEALVFAPVLELVAAMAHGGASGVFDRPALLQLAQRVSASLPVSGASTLQLIDNFASEAMNRNLKFIALGSSNTSSPIAGVPHVASNFTFHACTLPQTAFFSAALQASLGSGFADFSVCGMRADVIAETLEALRNAVLIEADRAHLSTAVKRKLADGESSMHAVQVFCTDSIEKTESLSSSITLSLSSISVFSNLEKDAEELLLKMQQLHQQIEHARMAHQDIAAVCGELQAATACISRPPLETHKARAHLLSFADHLLVDCLSGPHVSFADNIGEALLIVLDESIEDMFGLPQDYFRGSGALSRIKDALKRKGCVAQPDSRSSSWILEGIGRCAALKQESVIRLQSVLMRSNVQAVYNSSGGTVEEVMDDFDKCIVEFLMSVHNLERERGLQNSREFLETAVQKEIDARNTLDESAMVHASLTKMCDTMKPLVEKWKTDVETQQLQQSRVVGDALQNAVQLVWGVVFAPEHREELLKRCSECLSIHGIDATNSIMELTSGVSPLSVNIYERLTVRSLTRKDIGIEWTLICDPDERLPRIIELRAQCKDDRTIISSVRSDDPSLEGAMERSISDGHFLIVHVVEPVVPVVVLELVRTRTLKVFGRPYLRIGTRMLEMHRNFKIVLQLTTLKFDDVPELLSACRAIDFTLHSSYLEQHIAFAISVEMERESDFTQLRTPRAESSSEVVLESEYGIMRAINNPSIRSPSLDFELIESISEMLEAHLALQEEFKQQKQQLDQLPAATESHVSLARAAAHMLKSLRAMSSMQPDIGCSLPMLLDICHHIVYSLKLSASEWSPALFNMLSHHMASVPRLIFALLYSCARDPQFMAPEIIFLHSPIGWNVSPAIEGYEHPGTRSLDWLPVDAWARVAAFTLLPGVGVDVLKSLRSCADAWKKWYLSVDKGVMEQFPDGFSKKLTPLHCVCLARCFSEHLLRPSLQMYVARTLNSAYDESRFDPQSIIKVGVPAPLVIQETEGLHAFSAVLDLREHMHGDSSVVCVIADGTNWHELVSKICDNLSAGRWVVLSCMTSLPWDSFVQLHDGAARYYKESLARLFIMLCASGRLPRDASAMCLHLNASLSTAPRALFEAMYSHLLPLSLPRSQREMSVADAFKHLGCLRQAVFQLACATVLEAQRDILVKSTISFDLRNRTFFKAVGTRCASAANALFRHSREFPVANLPKGYTYAAVDDVVREALKELSDWAPVAAVTAFVLSLSSILGASVPPLTLQEQGGNDLTQYMSGFSWPSTLQALKVDVEELSFTRGRISSQLQVRLRAVPCMYPCRPIPLVTFDCKQLFLLLELLPSEQELNLQLRQPDTTASGDCLAACVSNVASMSMAVVCKTIVQLRLLITAAMGYCRGLVSDSELLSCVGCVSYFLTIDQDVFSIFTPLQILMLRSTIHQRLLPRYQALKSASTGIQSGVSLGAFHVPFRLLSAARMHAARNLRFPLESVRIQASVVAGLDAMAAPLLAVSDVLARNAILTTNKGNQCDAFIFGSQSFSPLPLSLFFSNNASVGEVGDDIAAGTTAIANVVQVPMMLQGSALQPEDVFCHEITLVDVRLVGIHPAQLAVENVYLAVHGY